MWFMSPYLIASICAWISIKSGLGSRAFLWRPPWPLGGWTQLRRTFPDGLPEEEDKIRSNGLVSLPPPLVLPLAAEAVTLFSKGITSSSQDLKQINLLISSKALHPMFLEHWNRQKILSSIRQCFSCLLDEWIANICKKKFQDAFLKILCFEMHMDRPDKSENTFGI